MAYGPRTTETHHRQTTPKRKPPPSKKTKRLASRSRCGRSHRTREQLLHANERQELRVSEASIAGGALIDIETSPQ